MKSNKKNMEKQQIITFGIIIIILSIIVGLQTVELIKYMNMPLQNIAMVESDFHDEIRSIAWDSNKEDIYNFEGREADEIETNQDFNSLLYNNARIESYEGTLRYILKKEKLVDIKFIFNKKEDYEKYMEEFKEKYSEGTEIYRDCWVWSSLSEKNTEIIAYHHFFLIEKKHYVE